MDQRYDDYTDFFKRAGEDLLKPMSYGECIWPVSVEELYQHFRDRMVDEMNKALLDGLQKGMTRNDSSR